MSVQPVLYDQQGPRGRRLTLVVSIVVALLITALGAVVAMRLAAQEQFSYEKWGPVLDPSNEYFRPIWSLIGQGLRSTLTAAALAILLSLLIGTIAGTSRMLLGRWSRIPLVGVMELLRGLPVIFLIFIAYRMLPDLGVNVGPLPGPDGLWYLVIGLTAYNSVIIAEILRSGVAALPKGQNEAAIALGLGRVATMRMILLPQAFRIMLPALISQLVVVLKDTSLAALIGVYIELLRRTNLIIADLGNPIQMYVVVGAIYIFINALLSMVATWTERRLGRVGARSAVPDPDIAPVPAAPARDA